MASSAPAGTRTGWKPTDKWLLGIVLAVINFWLFAQTLLNVIPGIQGELGVERTMANLAVSITSLFSGIFIVVAGGLADRLGRVKIMYAGIYLSILGSLLIALTPENLGGLTSAMLLGGRIVQGLSAACIMPSTMALVKAYYEGKDRQRALSFWSIGSWGGSGFCALFGGLMATSFLGWRSIFWISIILSVLALFLLKGTPESRAERDPATANQPFDWSGLIFFIVMLVAINVYISQGPNIGWLSWTGLALVAVFIVAGLVFLQIETRKRNAFVNLKLFGNGTFTGATLSNFLLNGAAGTLIVSLGLVQIAAGMSSLQSGLLTLGYLVAILATIRVGEKLLQRFGPKKPMLWGSMITGVGILMCSLTFLHIGEYIVLTVIGFTLFGVGLGFYATPSTDAALSNVPDAQVGAASGIYKMASSLGNAIGVAISAALYVAGQAVDPELIQSWGLFIGRQDNVALRFGGAIGLLFNVLMVVIAIASIILTVPSERKREEAARRPDEVAPPPIGN
ncbi:major facilitator superfamily protein [Arthrobacter crystallopoietes BAB-32]|uniref:Major facilitator superfamily protein n=1 Tax=Arthrobacter crystallopoietes BAB-32 TaxID=1246476 RepID=N1V6U5_9MICC|nr:MFS transporter [Arthrobacter crystallopoietes]EMY35807.1 major facilitator superfamily protein [Arthrobacter crystallopoietes BAB-32]